MQYPGTATTGSFTAIKSAVAGGDITGVNIYIEPSIKVGNPIHAIISGNTA
jgi:hypothetical protein